MNSRTRICSLLAIAATLAACDQPAAPDSGDADSVRATIAAANLATSQSVARGDANAIVTHYADDAMMLPAGANAVSGRAAIQGFFQRAIDAGMKELRLEIVSVDASGDLAVETGTYAASDAGGSHVDHGKYVVAWRRQDGAWRAYRDISTTSMPVRVSTPEGTPLPARCSDADRPAPAPASASQDRKD